MKQTKYKNWNYYLDIALIVAVALMAITTLYQYKVDPASLTKSSPEGHVAFVLFFVLMTIGLCYYSRKSDRLEAQLDAKVAALETYQERIKARFNGAIHIPQGIRQQQVVFDGVAFDFFNCGTHGSVGITIERTDTMEDEDAPCVDVFVDKTTLELSGETQGLRSLPVGAAVGHLERRYPSIGPDQKDVPTGRHVEGI